MFYYAVLGKDSTAFTPQGTKVMERLGPGQWSEAKPFYEKEFILWRGKTIDDVSYVIGYTGGENIYEFDDKPLTVSIHWLKTADGYTWEPVVPGKPIVQVGGGSETDFVFQPDGSLVSLVRDELGDALGWGSKICRAPADDLAAWDCVIDKRKYDSPLVFQHDGEIYVIGRRNLTATGNYDLEQRDLDPHQQTLKYLTEYSFQPKRCSLWHLDPATRKVSFILDLPSRGDTCFASVLPDGPNAFVAYNYSSQLAGEDCPSYPSECEDYSWLKGQGLPTMIYRVRLVFP